MRTKQATDPYREALLLEEELAKSQVSDNEAADPSANRRNPSIDKRKKSDSLTWFDSLNITTWSLIGVLMGIALSRALRSEMHRLGN